MAIAVLFLGALGLVGLESNEKAPAAAREAGPAGAQQIADERRRCGEVCALSDVPVYVPANRGSTSARIGGGSRHGSWKL